MKKDNPFGSILKEFINHKLIKVIKKVRDLIYGTKFQKQATNKYILVGIVLLILIFVIIFFPSIADQGSDIPIYKVKMENFLITITESGEIRAKNSISIMTPRIRGSLKIIYLVPEGTYVKPGEVVCKFDPSEALTSLKDLEARLEIAKMDKEKLIANNLAAEAQMETQLKSAELSFELSKMKLDQVKFEAQAVQQQTKLEHEKNRLSFEQTKQEYKSKKVINKSDQERMMVEFRQKVNDLNKAQSDLQLLTLKAPSEGLVVYGTNFANQGRKFAIGDTPWGGAEILTLPDLSVMESKTNINEVDISKVKVEQKVIVKLDAFQDSSFVGEISGIASIGKNKESNSNIKVFEVLISIKGRSDILRPGMTSSNKIIINEIPKTVFIPQEAVFEKNGERIVYLKNGSSFDECKIGLGEKGEDYIVVKKGLMDGDEIALVDPTIELGTNSSKQKKENSNVPHF